ncbi:GFA family protein [Porticoccaceae bacterium]|nr:GFA family protein [Porticoccaceae bacterium]
MIGSCLCGQVRYEISSKAADLYQCHCSLCRKITGSSCSTSIVVPGENFSWLSGENLSKLYIHSEGKRRRVVFCPNCSSSLPDTNPDKSLYWIPVGSLQEHKTMEVKAHIFVGSKAHWDVIDDKGLRYDEHFTQG